MRLVAPLLPEVWANLRQWFYELAQADSVNSPTGMICLWPGTSPPDDWLLAAGGTAAYGPYSDLAKRLGATSDPFTLPNPGATIGTPPGHIWIVKA